MQSRRTLLLVPTALIIQQCVESELSDAIATRPNLYPSIIRRSEKPFVAV